MRALLHIAALLIVTSSVFGADEERSVFGTHWVKYEPVQVAGELKGCSIVFTTVTADRAYLSGNWVALNGSIGLRAVQDGPLGVLLTFKLGLKDLQSDNGFERPFFAYLQTAKGSTAKAPQVTVDGDPGYKLFTYRVVEPAVAALLGDFIETPGVTIGYNRRMDGIDVMVPLDFTVVDSEITPSNEVIRKRSDAVITEWATCVSKLLAAVKK
jgi:hypothetical protein